jgi:N-formylglutamate amidohydrolase
MKYLGLILSIPLLRPATMAQAPNQAAQLVTVKSGTRPIIISCPHDGTEAVSGVGVRSGFAVDKFVTARDTGAGEIASKVADLLEKSLGGSPHVVIAKFSRQYIDANRPPQDAYEWKAAKVVYDRYHDSLAAAKNEVVVKWGRGLLIDIHGQAADRDAIFRGTNNGKTCSHMLDRFGKSALSGSKSVLGVMESKGYKVLPQAGTDDKENPRFGGGYIVQTYGSSQGGTVDAIQLELGWNHRSMMKSGEFASDLAAAITIYAKEYLPEKAIKP